MYNHFETNGKIERAESIVTLKVPITLEQNQRKLEIKFVKLCQNSRFGKKQALDCPKLFQKLGLCSLRVF